MLAEELVLITPVPDTGPLLEQHPQPGWENCAKHTHHGPAHSRRKKLCFSECLLGTSMLKSLQQGAQCLGQVREQNVQVSTHKRLLAERGGLREGPKASMRSAFSTDQRVGVLAQMSVPEVHPNALPQHQPRTTLDVVSSMEKAGRLGHYSFKQLPHPSRHLPPFLVMLGDPLHLFLDGSSHL